MSVIRPVLYIPLIPYLNHGSGQELEDLQALFMVTKPSSRFNTGDGAIESPRSKRDQRQEQRQEHPQSFWILIGF